MFQGIVAAVESRPQTLKQFMQVSSPFPFSMLFLTPKCFTFVNIEWGSGVFQGIVAAVVSSGGNFLRMSSGRKIRLRKFASELQGDSV